MSKKEKPAYPESSVALGEGKYGTRGAGLAPDHYSKLWIGTHDGPDANTFGTVQRAGEWWLTATAGLPHDSPPVVKKVTRKEARKFAKALLAATKKPEKVDAVRPTPRLAALFAKPSPFNKVTGGVLEAAELDAWQLYAFLACHGAAKLVLDESMDILKVSIFSPGVQLRGEPRPLTVKAVATSTKTIRHWLALGGWEKVAELRRHHFFAPVVDVRTLDDQPETEKEEPEPTFIPEPTVGADGAPAERTPAEQRIREFVDFMVRMTSPPERQAWHKGASLDVRDLEAAVNELSRLRTMLAAAEDVIRGQDERSEFTDGNGDLNERGEQYVANMKARREARESG